MLTMLYFHTNTHTEMYVPLITCITDDNRWGEMQQQVYQVMTSMNWSSVWLMSGMVLSKVSSVCESRKFSAFNLTPYA